MVLPANDCGSNRLLTVRRSVSRDDIVDLWCAGTGLRLSKPETVQWHVAVNVMSAVHLSVTPMHMPISRIGSSTVFLNNSPTEHQCVHVMKGDRVSDYNQTCLEGDNALVNYVAGDYHSLGKIALSCVRLIEVARHDQTVGMTNRLALLRYYKDVFIEHPCLVIKTDKVYSYTRNNICKFIRDRYAHTYEIDPIGKNSNKKRNVFYDFIDEESPANILFCVMSSWIKTPFIQTIRPSRDSQFFMKEPYTNKSDRTTKIGIIESIIFNIHDEFGYIIKHGKPGWLRDKYFLPFIESYKDVLGKEIFDAINKTMPWLDQMNKECVARNKSP